MNFFTKKTYLYPTKLRHYTCYCISDSDFLIGPPGLRLRSGWVGLSLGTSDTLLLGLPQAGAPPAGHVLVGPTEAPYMALLCFANGSLTRQNHRDRLAGNSWEAFNDLLRATVRGNMGYMGEYRNFVKREEL